MSAATGLGPRMTAAELGPFLRHVFAANLAAEAAGAGKTPLCLWGTHGIGKTETVEAVVRELGWKFSYLAPAQFEEMGDFLGMPRVEAGQTVYAAPAWVPREEGPGVLLLDDVNRADGRILRGIMQLLQRHETVAWRLPPGWQIACTANPEGGDYAVTPLDPAMLTRLLHVTLRFDPSAWAAWAERAAIDPRGIAFVVEHPELVHGERTTPRSLVQLFRVLAPIADWRAALRTVAPLAEACLDREAAAAFVAFLRRAREPLPSAKEILTAADFAATVLPRIARAVHGEDDDEGRGGRALDGLLLLCQRVAAEAASVRGAPLGVAVSNVRALLLAPFLPPDFRLVFARELATAGALGKRLLADPEVAAVLLAAAP